MDPHVASATILVLCLILILVTYVLGVEVGKAAKLRTHPGYEAAKEGASGAPYRKEWRQT
jgi:hypothetical protein